MTDASVNAEIAKALSRAHPPVIMTLEDVANFTGHSYNYLRNELQNAPDFPPRLPRFKQPRWSRDDVMRWNKEFCKNKLPPYSPIPETTLREVEPGLRVPTQLYRHFSETGVLLYVGVSLSAVSRLSQHKRSDWNGQIKKITIEVFPSRYTAMMAEMTAIKKERPLFNTVHKVQL